MQFEFDPESLIAAVKNRPGIWDPEHKFHKNKKARAQMWSEIVKELIQADPNAAAVPNTRELEYQLQTKWKSLRDRFIKYVTHPNQKKRPYIYTKQMQFVLKHKELPNASAIKENGSVGSTEDEEDERPTWKLKKKVKIDYDEKPYIGEVGDNDYDPLHPADDYVYNAMANVDTIVKEDNDTTINEDKDTDKMFLMSLLPHFKSISEENKLNAKTEIMLVLQKANRSK